MATQIVFLMIPFGRVELIEGSDFGEHRLSLLFFYIRQALASYLLFVRCAPKNGGAILPGWLLPKWTMGVPKHFQETGKIQSVRVVEYLDTLTMVSNIPIRRIWSCSPGVTHFCPDNTV